MTGCLDRGGDGLSASYALLYHAPTQCNVSWWFDGNHDTGRALVEMLKQMGLHGWIIIIMIIINLPHGPDNSDLRYNQLKQAQERLFQVHTFRSCALFQDMASEMLVEMEDEIPSRMEGQSREESLWLYIKEHNLFARKGYRCTFNRFSGVVRGSSKLLRHWTLLHFKCLYCALECDMLHNKALVEKVTVASGGADIAADTGATRATGAHERSLRSAAQNAVVIAVLMLGDPHNKRTLACVVAVGEADAHWQGRMSKACRSASDNADWGLGQVQGGFMTHMYKLLTTPADEGVVLRCGFLDAGLDVDASNDEVIANLLYEDSMAQLIGQAATFLTVARLKRGLLNILGWPWRMLRVLGNDDVAQRCIDGFKADLGSYRAFEVLAPSFPHARKMGQRSEFNTLAVRQLVECLEETRFCVTPAIREIMSMRARTTFSTQLAEDINNVQKNTRSFDKKDKQSHKHFRRPQGAFAAAITSKGAVGAHRFKEVVIDAHVARKTSCLGKEAFAASLGSASIPVKSVQTTSQQAPYFSPSVANMAAPALDHVCRAEALRLKQEKDTRMSWLGFWCLAESQICFRNTRSKDPAQWYIALHTWEDTACLVWPVRLVYVKDGFTVVEPLEIVEPSCMAFFSLDGVTGFTFTWRSWAWQQTVLKDPTLRPGIRRIRDNVGVQQAPILELCAQNAWLKLSKNVIVDACQYAKIKLAKDASFFEVLFQATKRVLKLNNDMDVFNIIKVRIGKLPACTKLVAELMALDEANVCLDEGDRKELKREQDKVVEDKEEFDDLVTAFREFRKGLPADGPKPKKAKTASLVPDYKGPRKLGKITNEMIPQPLLKEYLPPQSYIWVSRTSGAWCSRFPPFPENRMKFDKLGGERSAALAAIRAVWTQYMAANGLDAADNPIEGLFERDFPIGAAGGAAASSG